jgi:outer membrane autotransporter protein
VAVWDFEQEGTANMAGYEQSSFEASAGLQKAVGDGERWYAGLGLSYESTDIDADPATQSDGTLVQIGGVLKARLGPTTLALSAGWGTGSYDTQRRITGLEDELVARSEQDLTMYTLHLRGSYDFEGESWYVRPMLDLDYASIDLDGFTEQGAGAANLVVEGRDDQYSALRPAIEVGWEHAFENGTQLRPFARIGMTEVLDGESTAITASFADAPDGVAPFVTRVDGPDSYTDVAAGIDLLRTRGLSLRLGYFGQFSSRTDLNSIGLKLWMPLK